LKRTEPFRSGGAFSNLLPSRGKVGKREQRGQRGFEGQKNKECYSVSEELGGGRNSNRAIQGTNH